MLAWGFGVTAFLSVQMLGSLPAAESSLGVPLGQLGDEITFTRRHVVSDRCINKLVQSTRMPFLAIVLQVAECIYNMSELYPTSTLR